MEIPYTVAPRRDTGLYNAKVGIWLFLASEVMLFGALFSAYILLRVGSIEWPYGWLNIPLGTANTLVLITSSITTVMAWASLKMGNFGKFKIFHAITILCAITFLCIKSYEYHDKFIHYQVNLKDGRIVDGHMEENGKDEIVIHGRYVKTEHDMLDLHERKDLAPLSAITIKRSDIASMENYGPWHNTYTAIYFTLTGLHALHVIGGAVVISYLWLFGGTMWKEDPERFTNRVEISGLFWHFVDLVWIFLFPVLYLL